MVLLLTIVIIVGFLAVVFGLLAAALFVCVGPKRLRRATDDPGWFRTRLRSIAPYVLVLAFVLLINKGLQDLIQTVSAVIGYEATAFLYQIEGDLVAGFQSFGPDILGVYFALMYVFGYGLVLLFPLVAYLFAESLRPLKTLLVAYTINYGVAIVAYTLVIARGPRTASGSTDGILIELFPHINLLTAQFNRATNVFPSLHTSMSVTVLLLAVLTRDQFPRWLPVAGVTTGSIVLATMYLGIHWLVDVLAGIVLALVAVSVARRVVERREGRIDSQSGRSTHPTVED